MAHREARGLSRPSAASRAGPRASRGARLRGSWGDQVPVVKFSADTARTATGGICLVFAPPRSTPPSSVMAGLTEPSPPESSMSRFPKHAVAAAALLTLVGAPVAQAQNNPSPAVGVTLNATKKETLSLSASPHRPRWSRPPASRTARPRTTSTPINVTTNWNLKTSTSVTLVGYFTTPAQALLNGTNAIASSQVEGKLSTSPPPRSLRSQGAPVAGAGVAGATLSFWSQAVGGVDAPEQPHRPAQPSPEHDQRDRGRG